MKKGYLFLFSLILLHTCLSAQVLPIVEDTIALNDRFNFRQSVRFDAQGHVHATWTGQYDTDGTSREIFYASNKSGQFVTTQLTSNNVDNNFASFAFDPAGRIHMVYLEHHVESNTFQLVYRNNISGSFSEPLWVTSGANKASPNIAIGSGSIVHFAYNTYINSPHEDDHGWYRTYNHVTGTLGAEQQLAESNPSSEKETRVVVDSNNHAHIVMRGGSSWSGPLHYFNNTSGSMTEYDTPVEGNISSPAIVMDSQDNLHILYRRQSAIHYTRRDAAGSFSAPVFATPENVGNPAFYRTVDVDATGRLYFMYQNSTTTAPKGFFLVHGVDGSFEAPILVSNKFDDGYLTLNNTAVAARGNGDVAVTYSASAVRNGDIVCDIFLKKGNIFAPPAPHILVSPAHLHYDSVMVGVPHTLMVSVTNQGFAELVLEEVMFSSDDYSVDALLPWPMEPGLTVELPVVFTPSVNGISESYLFLKSNAPNMPQVNILLSASAVNVYFTLSILVVDGTGAHIPDAVITMNNTTYQPGEYTMQVLPGTYNITIKREGFYPWQGVLTMGAEDKDFGVMLEPATSTDDIVMESGIMIFPNPASGNLNVSSPWPLAELRLVNLSGILLLRKKVDGKEARLDLSGLDAGGYFLQLIINDRMITRKVMIR